MDHLSDASGFPHRDEASQQSLAFALMRAAVVGLLLSVPRAVFVLARFSDPLPVSGSLARLSLLRILGQGLWLSIPLAFILIAFSEWMVRRGLRPARFLPVVAVLGLGGLFITFRLPAMELYAPGWDSDKARAAHVGAWCVALVAALLARPRCAFPGLRAIGVFGLLLSVLCKGATLLGTGVSARSPERPNVILISLDTLRADRLQSYGYGRATSPNIERFFHDSWRFEQAFAPESWTLTSHATMLTGLGPAEHGVSMRRALPADVPTLAGRMRAAGYATMAIVDNCTFMDRRFGYARGFELYRRVLSGAAEKIEQAKELIDTVGDRPFLFFLHCYDAHSDHAQVPYEAKPAHRAQFAGGYDGDFRGCSPDGDACASRYLNLLNASGQVLAAEERAWISNSYDAGIATLDEQLGELFDYLEATGKLDNTIVILTSDHGEEFFEHEMALHCQFYVESLHVPLLIRTPGEQGRSVEALAGLVDVTPTILDLCGLWVEQPGAPSSAGQSTLPWMRGARLERRFLIAEDTDTIRGVRSPDGALVHRNGGWELYDTRLDPGQTNDVLGDPRYAELEAELRGYLHESELRLREHVGNRAGAGSDDAREIVPEGNEQLEALGYAGDY